MTPLPALWTIQKDVKCAEAKNLEFVKWIKGV